MSDERANGIFLTDDQLHTEETAARLMAHPRSQAMLAEVAKDWIARIEPDADHRARFDDAFGQAAFSGFMHAAADDPLYPRLYAFGRLAHETAGLAIPATKSAHPNPDYIYRFITVDGGSRYVLRGRVPRAGPIAAEYAMLDANQAYQKNVSLSGLVIEPDGSLVITIDPDPADGRPNHFQSNAESVQILLREVVGEGSTHAPIALAVERVAPPAARGPRSFEEMLDRAEMHVRKHIADMSWVTENFVRAKPVNVFEPPRVQPGTMYSVGQAYSAGNFRIADDEALLVHMTLAGAAYACVPVSDFWGGVGDLLGHTVNLGTDAALPNPDGSYSFAVALRDPGIANWVDTDGLHSGALFFRWIGLPPGAGEREAPQLDVRVVRLDALDALLPAGVPRRTPAERQDALARRARAHRRVMG